MLAAFEVCTHPATSTHPTHPAPPVNPPGPSNATNLNGEYKLSETAKSDTSKFPTNYKDYPGGAEYFDVYSPLIVQHYSQVYWKGFDPVPLPPNIVQRFKGKGMAIIGYELDQVRKTDKGDVSVPINVVYNHHFESHMGGAKSKIEKVKISGPDDPRLSPHQHMHGIPEPWKGEAWVVTDLTGGTNAIPTSQSFGGANGAFSHSFGSVCLPLPLTAALVHSFVYQAARSASRSTAMPPARRS